MLKTLIMKIKNGWNDHTIYGKNNWRIEIKCCWECSHQFKKDNIPHGATLIFLLAESHLSIHTFVDEGKTTLDLFTCSLGVETEKIKSIIKIFLR